MRDLIFGGGGFLQQQHRSSVIMGKWRDWELPASRLPPALLGLGQLSPLHALYPGRRLKLLLGKKKLHFNCVFSNEPELHLSKCYTPVLRSHPPFPRFNKSSLDLGSQPLGWLVSWENGKSVRCLSIGRFMTKETGLRVYNAIKETEGKSPWVKSD